MKNFSVEEKKNKAKIANDAWKMRSLYCSFCHKISLEIRDEEMRKKQDGSHNRPTQQSTDGQTDKQTDPWMDAPSHRDARMTE